MNVCEVLRPGAATSVRRVAWGRGHLGRAHHGVSAGGPADPLAAVRANLLVHNPPRGALFELTLQGPVLRFLCDTTLALCGAPFDMRLDGHGVACDEPLQVRAGQVLDTGRCTHGLRGMLAVRGGIDEALDGRALSAGDVVGSACAPEQAHRGALPRSSPIGDDVTLRTTLGPEAERFSPEARRAFFSTQWRVAPTSDRRGVRLEGAPVLPPPWDMVTQGVTAGAVQVPASGQPIIVFMDQQTTGGYPRIAHVITLDLGCVGQLRPGQRVRFEEVGVREAHALFRAWADVALGAGGSS